MRTQRDMTQGEAIMRKNSWSLIVSVVALLALAGPAMAHHGTAAYETDKSATVTGTVTRFDFTNPHVILAMTAKGSSGNTTEWQAELTSPNHLARVGWSRNTLKPGDQITISGFLAKSGANSMWIQKISRADGTPLSLGGGGDN